MQEQIHNLQPPKKLADVRKAYRGISNETYARYGVYVTKGPKGEPRLCFPYRNKAGKAVGYKTISKDKKMSWPSHIKDKGKLFGIGATPNNRRLVITEGEFDALSVHELTGYSAVSIPNGASSAASVIKEFLDYIEQFSQVHILFDNDEHGQEAAHKAAELIDPAKVSVAKVPSNFGKDPNDLLQSNDMDFKRKSNKLKEVLFAAEQTTPDFIADPLDFQQRVLDWAFGEYGEGKSTGIAELDDKLGGWRRGEVTTIVAPTGVGKSTFSRSLLASLLNRGHKCLLVSLEEPPEVSVQNLARIVYGPAHSKEELEEQLSSLLRNLIVYDSNGSQDPDTFYKRLEYAARGQDVEFILLDNLTRALGRKQDPKSETDQFLNALTDVAKKQHVHVFNVTHTKRTDAAEGAPPTIQDARDSGLIEAYSDNIITLGRKRDSADNVTNVKLEKNRCCGQLTSFQLTLDEYRFKEVDYHDGRRVSQASRGTGQTQEQEEQRSVGQVSTQRRANPQLRQQSGSEGSGADGADGDSVLQVRSTAGQSSDSSGENSSSLPGLPPQHGPRQNPPRSEGVVEPRTPTNLDGRNRAEFVRRFQACSAAYWNGGPTPKPTDISFTEAIPGEATRQKFIHEAYERAREAVRQRNS